MTYLVNRTIPQLIAHLDELGVKWVGKTTRKTALIELINKFPFKADYLHNDREAAMTANGILKGITYPLSSLVGMMRYWGEVVTSEELSDLSVFQERVLEVIRQKYPLEMSMEWLKKLNTGHLIEVLEGLGVVWDTPGCTCERTWLIVDIMNFHNIRESTIAKTLTLDELECHNIFDLTGYCLHAGIPIPASIGRLDPLHHKEALVGFVRNYFDLEYADTAVCYSYREDGEPLPRVERRISPTQPFKIGSAPCCSIEATPLPTLDKVLGYGTLELNNNFSLEYLRVCERVLGLHLSDTVTRDSALWYIKLRICELRRCPSRNLYLNLDHCNWIFNSHTQDLEYLPRVWGREVSYPQIIKSLRERGFYEPDLFDRVLEGVYFCCNLGDAPNTQS